MVQSLPLPVQRFSGCVGWPRGLILALIICAPFSPAVATGEEKKKPPEENPALRDVDPRTLASGLAARIVAGGNGPGTIGLLLSGRQLALWGDWPRNTKAERRPPEKAPALDPRWLGVLRDLKPFDNSRAANRELKVRNAVLILAAQTPPEALANSARVTRGATVDNLLRDPKRYRGKVVRVRGRLKHLWVEEAPDSLKNQGIENIYDGWIFTDDQDTRLVAVTFSELPGGIKTGNKINYRVEFDGYFLKKQAQTSRDLRVMPWLVGQGIRRYAGPLPKSNEKEAPSVKHLLLHVKDGKGVPQTPDKDVEEVWALTETLALAAKTPEKALEESAAKNRYLTTFAHLLRDPAKYRGKVLPLKGYLGRIRKFPAPEYLKARGIQVIYEGWIFPRKPLAWCVLFTELPEDIKVGSDQNYLVTFNGYFFKKYRYHAEEKNEDRFAPLLIGRTIHRYQHPASLDMAGSMSTGFVIGLTTLIGGTVLLVVALSWWFRRGDRRLHRRLAEMQRQPVLEPAGDQQSENGYSGSGLGETQRIAPSPTESGKAKDPQNGGFFPGTS